MPSLPDDVVKSLVRGVGSFMRKTPANELPRSLRALRNFREKALLSQSDQVLAALEDKALRARLVDWLGDKPALSRSDARALEVAARREDGWEEALSKGSNPKRATGKKAPSDETLKAKLQDYKERAAAARLELSKVRRETRTEVARHRREIDELVQESKRLAAEIKRLRGEVADARHQAKTAEARAERERRRVRAQEEKSEERQESLKARVRALKEENTELKRGVARSETRKKASSSGRRKTQRPAKRSPLPVPTGLLDDARETLKEWLSNHELTLVVDGYNVTKHEKGFGDLALEKQRDRLIAELQRLSARFAKASIVCVFDGTEVLPGTARRKKGRVKIEYSRAHETADDHIVALVKDLPPDPVVVVTSDRELQQRVRRLAATVATSPQLLEVARKA
jgi:predicted RNA-binding protein with PIN domain